MNNISISISMSHNISRSSKKYKTSILFQVKHNTEKPVEVGQSLNIIALRKGNLAKLPSQPEQSYTTKNSTLIDNFLKKQKTQKKQNRSPKISIQLKSGQLLEEIYEIKNVQKFQTKQDISSNVINNRLWNSQEPADAIDRLRREYKIVIDKQKGKLTCHVDQFSSLCTDFMKKITNLQEQKSTMSNKILRYKSYFQELKAKENCDSPEQSDKNPQLKILNLERKVQTLNYIVKNYRNNNKEEAKIFEKKINDFKPNLENDLVQMLAAANSKIEQLQNKINYFQKECQKHYRNGNWVEIVRKMQEKDGIITKLQQNIIELETKLKGNEEQNLKAEQIQQKLIIEGQKNKELQKKLFQLRIQYEDAKKAKLFKEKQFDELSRCYEQLTFKYQGLVILETKILEKQDQIKKNSLMITRLQNQNYCLKAKIDTLNRNTNGQFFGCHSNEVDKIQEINAKIDELSNRFSEELEKKTMHQPSNPSSQMQFLSFIMHIFQKVKDSFEKIINEYTRKIQELILQKKQLGNIVENNTRNYERKMMERKSIIEEIEINLVKRKRCAEGVEKFNNISSSLHLNRDCSACKNWMLHWGQLDSLYEQLYLIADKLKMSP